MKKILMTMLAIMFMFSTASFASDIEERGVKVDAKVYKPEVSVLDSINVEVSRDIKNDDTTVYLKFELDLTDLYSNTEELE